MSAEQQTARDAILAAVRQARPPAVARVEAPRPAAGTRSSDLTRTDAFVAAAIAAGADVTVSQPDAAARVIDAALDGASSVLSFATGVSSRNVPEGGVHALAALDAIVFETTLGVAENGAVWIATGDERFRAGLFLAERVVVVVAESALVEDLHDAYARIDVRAFPFGAFIAGPSKTADIEQSLVIGAHGPKQFSIVVVRA
jgi:L-lactate dehydrogenase complex protein LldG